MIEVMWIVWYQDASVPPEVFAGSGAEDAAREFFEEARGHWTVVLLKEVRRS